MNAKNIESKFAAMGARLKVREIPPEWRRWFGWQRSEDYAVDIQKDHHGQFFELSCANALERLARPLRNAEQTKAASSVAVRP